MTLLPLCFILFWVMTLETSANKLHRPTPRPNHYNETRGTAMGIAEYRSALTLDWLAAEDSRQRELVAAFEAPGRVGEKPPTVDCIMSPRPAIGTVARLMLEMLRNLEGDADKSTIYDFIQALVKSKLLKLEPNSFDNEPDLDALVKTPLELAGEPHVTFPRTIAIAWMAITDPTTVKKHGWCTIARISKYINMARPQNIARHMRFVDSIISRTRYIMEDFIQHVAPLNILQSKSAPTPKKHAVTYFPTNTIRQYKAKIGSPRVEVPSSSIIRKRPTKVIRISTELQRLVMGNVTQLSMIDVSRLKTPTREMLEYEAIYSADRNNVHLKTLLLLLPTLFVLQ